MTIIEKMYAGEKLSEKELKLLATGYDRYCDTEPGEFEAIDEVEHDSGRWTTYMGTIIKVGNDLWEIPWEKGLTEYQENMFYEQPCRVQKREKQIVVTEYVKVEE